MEAMVRMKKQLKPKKFFKGDICGWDFNLYENIGPEEKKMIRILKNHNPCYGLILKFVDEAHVLVALIHSKQLNNTKKIQIGNRVYWVKFSQLWVVPISLVTKKKEKEFIGSYPLVTLVFDSHNRYLKERRKQKDKKQALEDCWDIVLREGEKRRDEFYRMNAPMEHITVPNYLRQSVMHPYSGGGVSPR